MLTNSITYDCFGRSLGQLSQWFWEKGKNIPVFERNDRQKDTRRTQNLLEKLTLAFSLCELKIGTFRLVLSIKVLKY